MNQLPKPPAHTAFLPIYDRAMIAESKVPYALLIFD